MALMLSDRPNPGSDEAVEQGCTCPVLDNAHGKGYLLQPGVFWINEHCPIHGKPEEDSHD